MVEENNRKRTFKKKAAAIVAVILALLIAFGGTYAWRDYKQHKTNEFSNTDAKYEAVLVEDFKEKDKWRVSDGEIKKLISVTNTGSVSRGFEEVYVRIQLKEYMEITPIIFEETKDRYMVDTDGYYIYFASEAAARAAYPNAPFDSVDGGYGLLKDAVSGAEGYFIPTKEKDANGQYGKYIVTKYEPDTGHPIKVTPGIDRASEDAKKIHKHDVVANGVDNEPTSYRNGECDYRKYIWDGTTLSAQESPSTNQNVTATTTNSPTMEYIKWILGTDVITLTEWLAAPYNGEPVAKWIIDDRTAEADPWIYWGEALCPGQSTADFMKAVELIKQPDGNFYYAIHTEMQAASLLELSEEGSAWLGAPAQWITAMEENPPSVIFDFSPLADPITLVLGENYTYAGPAVTVTPGSVNNAVKWTSSEPTIASVNAATGEVTALSKGTTKITATGANGKKASYTVIVTDEIESETPKVYYFTDNWNWTADGNGVFVCTWEDGVGVADFPGVPMEPDGTDTEFPFSHKYKFTIPEGHTKIIFSNGASGGDNQSEDFPIDREVKGYYTMGSKNGNNAPLNTWLEPIM